MPFLIKDNAQKILVSRGLDSLLKGTTKFTQIELDLGRTTFWGSVKQAQDHRKGWNTVTEDQTKYYVQGDMSASNLFLLQNPQSTLFPFIKKDEEIEEYKKHVVRVDFAFIDKAGSMCGMQLVYRRDEPTQWMIGLVKNTQYVPAERSVYVMSNSKLPATATDIESMEVDRLNNPLVDAINNDEVKAFLQLALKPASGAISTSTSRLDFVLRFINPNTSEAAIADPVDLQKINLERLFAANPALELFEQNDIKLSFAMLQDCLSDKSGLCQLISEVPYTPDTYLRGNKLQLALFFYENQLLPTHRAFLQQLLDSTHSYDASQRRLIPFLLKKGISSDQIDKFLKDNKCAKALTFMQDRGITEDLARYVNDKDKMEQLQFILQLDSENHRKLCLVFWAKSHDESEWPTDTRWFRSLALEIKPYPLLADMLLDQDKNELMSPADLRKLAFIPRVHVPKSIAHHYAEEFAKHRLSERDLLALGACEWGALEQSFAVLRQVQNKDSLAYRAVIKKDTDTDKKGSLLRLILPGLVKETDFTRQQRLVQFVLLDSQTQGRVLADISDPKLLAQATKIRERCICIAQLQGLGFSSEIITFVADEQNPKASCVREIILRVEEHCTALQEEIKLDHIKIQAWQCVEIDYRTSLYAIAYSQCQKPLPEDQLKKRLLAEQDNIVPLVDLGAQSWLHSILVVHANIAIMALSLTIANEVKLQRTGNFWFFNQSVQAEGLRALGGQVFDILKGLYSEKK